MRSWVPIAALVMLAVAAVVLVTTSDSSTSTSLLLGMEHVEGRVYITGQTENGEPLGHVYLDTAQPLVAVLQQPQQPQQQQVVMQPATGTYQLAETASPMMMYNNNNNEQPQQIVYQSQPQMQQQQQQRQIRVVYQQQQDAPEMQQPRSYEQLAATGGSGKMVVIEHGSADASPGSPLTITIKPPAEIAVLRQQLARTSERVRRLVKELKTVARDRLRGDRTLRHKLEATRDAVKFLKQKTAQLESTVRVLKSVAEGRTSSNAVGGGGGGGGGGNNNVGANNNNNNNRRQRENRRRRRSRCCGEESAEARRGNSLRRASLKRLLQALKKRVT